MRYLPLASLMLASAAVCGVPLAAHAAGPRFEVTPFVGYRTGGSFEQPETATSPARDVDLDDGSSWGIDLGLYRDGSSFYELLYSTQSTSMDSSDPTLSRVDVQTDYYHFGGTLLFADEQWMVPYLSLTAGATRFSADGGYGSETKFSMSLGGGLRLPFSDNLAATLGLRGYLSFIDSDSQFFCASGGEQSGCLVRSSGSTYFQGEAQLGLTLRF
jgi:opacity protein-like surface antigen